MLCYNRCATTSAFLVAGRKNQRRSLEKWHKRLRNRFASLENKSSPPHSVHPRAHTPEEVNLILQLIRQNPEKVNLILQLVRRDPDIGLNESYAKLLDKGYPRNFVSLYRSNRIPSRVLPSSDGKTRYLTPFKSAKTSSQPPTRKIFSDFPNFFVTRD